MLISTDSFTEISTDVLQNLLKNIQDELHERAVKDCQNAMTQLYELIEAIQVKNFDIWLTDIHGNSMKLNIITEIEDKQFDVGYVFGNHPEITGEDTFKIQYYDDGSIVCPHRNDDTLCHKCEIRKICWKEEN